MIRRTQISVVTPLYNGEKYPEILIPVIAEAASVVQEHYADCGVEYILVNDSPGSCSGMEETIRKLEDIYKGIHIVYMENEKNEGIHASRVNGLLRTEGEYILFLDQDDKISRTALYLWYAKMVESPQTSVVVANGYRQTCDSRKSLYTKNTALKLASFRKMYLYGTDMIFSPGQCLIKKADIPKEWEENILYTNGSDDFYLWLLMLEKNCRFDYIEQRIYYHMETDGNYSASFEKMCDSYEQMCALLSTIGWYPKRNIKVLKRRLRLKRNLRENAPAIKKFICTLKNPDIVLMTLIYKMAGYY